MLYRKKNGEWDNSIDIFELFEKGTRERHQRKGMNNIVGNLHNTLCHQESNKISPQYACVCSIKSLEEHYMKSQTFNEYNATLSQIAFFIILQRIP